MFNFKKLRKNVKAISPVISVLLMIAVAVVASLVAYAWVMGYIGGQTQKTGEAIQIQSVSGLATTNLEIYVQNVGQGTVKLVDDQCVYVNGTLLASTPVTGTGFDIATGNLQAQSTAHLTVAAGKTVAAGDVFVIKVTVAGGTFSQITKIF
jgi:flagellin-like protein